MSFACTACHSENTRRVPLIYRDGLSVINTSTGGAGLGLGRGGIGVFGGRARTRGTQQSLASIGMSPPEKRPLLGQMLAVGFILYLVGLSAAELVVKGMSADSIVSFITLFAVMGLPLWFLGRRLLKTLAWNRNQLPVEMQQWESSFRCDRCGEVFIPARA